MSFAKILPNQIRNENKGTIADIAVVLIQPHKNSRKVEALFEPLTPREGEKMAVAFCLGFG